MIPVGNPGSGYDDAYGYPEDGYIFDSSKMVKTLGRPLIRFEQSILDTARVFERYL